MPTIVYRHSSNMNNYSDNTGYRPIHTLVPYDRDNDVSPMIRVSFITGTVSPMDYFGSEGYVSPFAAPRIRSQPTLPNLARGTTMPRSINPRPRLTSHSDPILMGNQQNIGLEKLRREIYNPRIPRINLYYRDFDARSKPRENEDGKSCVVCLDDFEPREMVTLTPCNHMFHENCIVPWVKSHGQCPVCRFVISERNNENERRQPINNSDLRNDPFARDLVSFIRDMEGRG
ncbi:putative transcription factor C2H2 family [Helianthus annuus]|nr:putative transcription factor C2H2 family [Helianthus annuus]KAJ0636840.1 putative transcription factor C2H2 family [Helianthus annuus]KAJ0813875.1 putative transcription factor C2H2 family [Helianthus annuus]